MAVPTFLHEFSSPVAAAKLWKAAVKEASLVKNRVDVLDQDSYVYKYSVVEGNDKFESNSFQVKLEASGDGGSICKISGEFKTKGDGVPNEEEIKAVEEGIVKMFKAVEGYLIANPNAYP
ncbi:hypothetical protein GIB67_020504 [Kingdonia uniflora]|uniref:Bet v I/Major latex protein domain-containing protein n=1 Tax=Kingdonia uniflora TaxID=39325 RepID=A0A7J7PBX3_9MAGN|nr:hypothetical protein GIB67_020504 [Kingdonia uniflora]